MVLARPFLTCACLTLSLAACGSDSPPKGDAPNPDAAAASADSGRADGVAESPVTPEDIGRWEKGMAAELKAVREAGAKLGTAKTGEDTLAALMGVQEMTTTGVGAKAAGVGTDRYQVLRTNLAVAVAYLTPHLGGIDTTLLTPAQRDEMHRTSIAQLKQLEDAVPAEVVEALKPKADALRKREIELAGARLKGAGM